MRNDLCQKPQARVLSFAEQERICENEFLSGGPYWHLSTDGSKQEIIFIDDDDFKYAMTFLAVSVLEFQVKVIAFAFMNNHIHWILEGQEAECIALFNAFKKKLNAFLHKKGRYGVLDDFDCGRPVAITTLEQMRNEIAYVHRNPYVVRQDVLPYTYRWGDGYLYFNPIVSETERTGFNDLGFDEKRAILHSRIRSLPQEYVACNGYILPEGFSCFKRGMSFFRHASHYFGCIAKSVENNIDIAGRLGDKIVLNDEEIYPLTVKLSKKMFGNCVLKELAVNQRIEIARKLHFEYNVGNKQISRILAVSVAVLEEMFPSSV